MIATAAFAIGITADAAQSEPIIKQRNGLMAAMWRQDRHAMAIYLKSPPPVEGPKPENK